MKRNILLFFSVFLLFSCSTKKNIASKEGYNLRPVNSSSTKRKVPSNENEVFTTVEVMPSIASCGENNNYNKTGSCTNKKLANFIYKNLKYPKIGKKSKIIGIVAVKFVVDADGGISDIGIKCNKIMGTEEERKAFADEAVRVIKKMKTSDIKWNPGSQGGRKVRALYYYPIMFRDK